MRSLAVALTLGVAISFVPFIHSAQAGPAHVGQVQAKKHVVKGTIAGIDGATVTMSYVNKNGDKKDAR